jgi:hypothetical protein
LPSIEEDTLELEQFTEALKPIDHNTLGLSQDMFPSVRESTEEFKSSEEESKELKRFT